MKVAACQLPLMTTGMLVVEITPSANILPAVNAHADAVTGGR